MWDLTDVLNYFHSDLEVRNELTQDEFQNLVQGDSNFLSLLKKALEYQGFDPRTIMKQLIKNRKAYMARAKEVQKWDLSNTSENFAHHDSSEPEHVFTSEEKLSRDLEFLIMIFLVRNNHLSKVSKKSYNGLEDILNMLKDKYDINDDVRKSGVSLANTDITLPRIAGMVPFVPVKMFHENLVKEIVPYMSIPGVADVEKLVSQPPKSPSSSDKTPKFVLSHAICCPFLPSLHPSSKEQKTNIHAIMLYVAVRMDEIIHKKDSAPTPLSELLVYYNAGYESQATPQKSRLEVMKKIGLMKSSRHEFIEEALTVNAHCLEVLRAMRTDDPSHDKLIAFATNGVYAP